MQLAHPGLKIGGYLVSEAEPRRAKPVKSIESTRCLLLLNQIPNVPFDAGFNG